MAKTFVFIFEEPDDNWADDLTISDQQLKTLLNEAYISPWIDAKQPVSLDAKLEVCKAIMLYILTQETMLQSVADYKASVKIEHFQ